jgi:hypothetical protein
MKEKKQGILFDDFDDLDWWKKEWQNMPEFIMDDLTSFQSVHVHFETIESREEFSELIEQNITSQTRSLWYPKIGITTFYDKRYIDKR